MSKSSSHVETENNVAFAVLGSFLVWTDLYNILHALNWKRSPEWNCRLVTALHACISASLCLLSMFVLGPWPFSHIGKTNNELHNVIIINSLGYFLFDLVWCVYMRTEGLVMLAHHSLSIFGFSYVVYYNRYGCDMSTVLGASELTNPLLQMRWFMRQTGVYCGTKAKLLDWTFAGSFYAIRLGVGTWFYLTFLTSPGVDLVPKLGGSGFYIINVIFGVQLLHYMRKKYMSRTPGIED